MEPFRFHPIRKSRNGDFGFTGHIPPG